MLDLLDYRSSIATQNTSTVLSMKNIVIRQLYHSIFRNLRVTNFIWKLKNNKVNFKIYREVLTKTKKKIQLKK